MNTLQKEFFFGQADRTFGDASRRCAIGELLALLGDNQKERNERSALKKMQRKLVGSTGELLALLFLESKTDF